MHKVISALIASLLLMASLGSATAASPSNVPYPNDPASVITSALFQDADMYMLPEGTRVIQSVRGSVTAEDTTDSILLLGKPFDDNALFISESWLLVKGQDGGRGLLAHLPDDIGAGYGGAIELFDFNGDGIPEVFYSSSTGGSGGIMNYGIYSFAGGVPQLIFSSETNPLPQFEGSYMPDYKATVTVGFGKQAKTHVLDVSSRRDLYAELGIYRDGQLLQDVEVWGGPYALLEPVRIDRTDVYQLKATTEIRGACNADRIAALVSTIRWTKYGWRIVDTELQPYD